MDDTREAFYSADTLRGLPIFNGDRARCFVWKKKNRRKGAGVFSWGCLILLGSCIPVDPNLGVGGGPHLGSPDTHTGFQEITDIS